MRLRHCMKAGLLRFSETAEAGYQLFEPEMVERVKRIRLLQSERRILVEIGRELGEA